MLISHRDRLIDILPDDGASNDEITLYIKGFLGRGESAEHYDAWGTCHALLQDRLGWGSHALGFPWSSGNVDDIPAPLLATARIAWDVYRRARGLSRASLVSHVGLLAGEEVVRIIVKFAQQYRHAQRAIEQESGALAEILENLSERGKRVRIVAHSLGCELVIQAVRQLTQRQRPQAMHLCAPACCEQDLGDQLDGLANGLTVVYYTNKDIVLETAYRIVSSGPAIGSVGLRGDYARLMAVDVSDSFEFWVHNEYRRQFHRFAVSTG